MLWLVTGDVFVFVFVFRRKGKKKAKCKTIFLFFDRVNSCYYGAVVILKDKMSLSLVTQYSKHCNMSVMNGGRPLTH